MKESFNVEFETRVVANEINPETGEKVKVLDKSNAIHSQNMARTIARGLANEPSHFIHRIAFGNGGSFTDAGEVTILNPPNDGTRGDGWESRLYNETYSEIINEGNWEFTSGEYEFFENTDFGTDPGSYGPNSTRPGGGAVPGDDPGGGGVTSLEVGRKSNIIARMFINQNEPTTQLPGVTVDSTIEGAEKTFEFDELGFYTFGRPASSTPAESIVNVGNKISSDSIPPSMFGNIYNINYSVQGVSRTAEITIPGTGSGPGGEVTYGDLCEGINTGAWLTGGDPINTELTVLITDQEGGSTYSTISGEETFGNLVFRSVLQGATATLQLDCAASGADLLFVITGDCVNVDTTENTGVNAGVQNDAANPGNERERLLTHITFSPILKKANRIIEIEYTLTVSVSQTQSTSTRFEPST